MKFVHYKDEKESDQKLNSLKAEVRVNEQAISVICLAI
jgi:hypothetical protein